MSSYDENKILVVKPAEKKVEITERKTWDFKQKNSRDTMFFSRIIQGLFFFPQVSLSSVKNGGGSLYQVTPKKITENKRVPALSAGPLAFYDPINIFNSLSRDYRIPPPPVASPTNNPVNRSSSTKNCKRLR